MRKRFGLVYLVLAILMGGLPLLIFVASVAFLVVQLLRKAIVDPLGALVLAAIIALSVYLASLAFEPVMAERVAGATTAEARRAALLSITVVDSAAGSGHFSSPQCSDSPVFHTRTTYSLPASSAPSEILLTSLMSIFARLSSDTSSRRPTVPLPK